MKIDISEIAGEWFFQIREGELSEFERRQFFEWLSESPVHLREYLAIAEAWGGLNLLGEWPEESTEELFEIIQNAKDDKVVMLKNVDINDQHDSSFSSESTKNSIRKNTRTYRPMALVACLVLAVLVIGWMASNSNTQIYTTSRGEQRSVVLEDGSVVQLNTLSRMVVQFSKQRRLVKLSQGEAFFRVAKDKERPFEVETPFAMVRAVGTEFNIYNHPDNMRVAVVEGKVRVVSVTPTGSRKLVDNQPLSSVALLPQQTVNVNSQGEIGIPNTTQDIQRAIAWIQRRITLDNDSLETAVEEFNRYNKLQLKFRDSELAELRISGVFDADDPAALIKYVQHTRHVKIQKVKNQIILQGDD